MKATSILSLVLAIALLILTVRWVRSASDDATPANPTSAIDNIMTRASVRSYATTPIEDEKINTLLKAGMAAPSGMDKRPWHFIVVTDTAKIHALAEANPRSSATIAHAPLVIVVCGDMQHAAEGGGHDNWILDTAAATENILLAAHALGLGAVWTGVYPRPERLQKVAEVLCLPPKIIPLSAVVIGYPVGQVTPKDKWDVNKVSYNKYGEK